MIGILENSLFLLAYLICLLMGIFVMHSFRRYQTHGTFAPIPWANMLIPIIIFVVTGIGYLPSLNILQEQYDNKRAGPLFVQLSGSISLFLFALLSLGISVMIQEPAVSHVCTIMSTTALMVCVISCIPLPPLPGYTALCFFFSRNPYRYLTMLKFLFPALVLGLTISDVLFHTSIRGLLIHTQVDMLYVLLYNMT